MPPVRPATRLPAGELSPEVFERLVLEYAWRVELARDVQVYGRRGQKQYGLDIVGLDRDRQRFVYQVRRLAAITAAEIRAAVVDYAGPPHTGSGPAPKRRFGATRFVLATAAALHDDTSLVDEIVALQNEYRGDLDIEVIGIEHLSVKLREAVGIVAAYFGRDWAREFCGAEPPDAATGQATGFGLLEWPLAEHGLEQAAEQAQRLRASEPGQAADIHQSIAEKFTAVGYPGHAEIFLERAAEDLDNAGDAVGAFDLRWKLAFDGLLRGDTRGWWPRSAPPDDLRLARSALLRAALDWYGQENDLAVAVPALRTVVEAGDAHGLALVTIMLEQAVVDELFAEAGSGPAETSMTGQLVALAETVLAAAPGDAAERGWRVRLRCALADAAFEQSRRSGAAAVSVDDIYGQVVSDAAAGRIPRGHIPMVHARMARAHAVAAESDQAIDQWRRAIMAALPDFGGDASEAFKSMSGVITSRGEMLLPDLKRLSRSITNKQTLLGAASDPAVEALDALRGGYIPQALQSVRRCIWQARLSGHLYDERWALVAYADVMKAAGRADEELRARVAAGDAKLAVPAAKARNEWLDVRDQLLHGPPWVVAAAATVLAAESDLVPDDAVPEIVGRLIGLAENVATSPAVDGQPPMAAFRALAAFGHRLGPEGFDPVLGLVRPHLETANRLTEPATRILRGMYRAIPEHRPALTALLAAGLGHAHPLDSWAAVRRLREPGDELEKLVRDRAAAGDTEAVSVLAEWQVPTPEVRQAARREVAALLRTPTGHPRNNWAFGGSNRTLTALGVAVLVAGGDREDVSPEMLTLDPSTTASDPAAVTAAGPVLELAAAVADKLLDMAADRYDMAVERADAVNALAVLSKVLPAATLMSVVRRLLEVAQDPQFGPHNDAEVFIDDPLRTGIKFDLGGRHLASQALMTAAVAYRQAGDQQPACLEESLTINIHRRAEIMLSSEDDAQCEKAATCLVTLAALTPVDVSSLARHPAAGVRALAMDGWVASDIRPPGLPARLLADADASVRASVVRHAGAVLADPRAAKIAATPLDLLRNDRSWRVRKQALRVPPVPGVES